jgi:diguanylate cyclase (GGDEF)-like protein
LQSRRTAQWGAAAAACVVLALAIAFVARRQAQRNRLLASRNRVLRIQAEHDPLTGLANRAHLRTRQLARGSRFEGALFLVDVDHFKDINDRHGHAAGDAVLVEIARRLERVLRDRDLVVRWGGEEFLVVVDAMPADEAVVLARRLMKAFAGSPIVVDGQPIAVTASIGFAVFPLAGKPQGVGFDGAFALVDAAMYHSKAQGRACATRIASVDAHLPLEQATLPTSLAGGAILEVHRPAEEFAPA